MLPFTKRPGRGDESGDNDVVTKDDVAKPATVPPPAASKKNAAAAPTAGAPAVGGRAKFASMNEEEMTTLMPTKSLGDAVRAAVRPAAGAPPPSRQPSSSPSASPSSRGNAAPSSRGSSTSASRSGKFAAVDEDEDGRTVVRGAPKIVKRTTNAPNSKMGMPTSPTTISPAAVIKATLESARGAQAKRTGEHLMAGPPSDLLEDLADLRHPADVGAEHTAILQAPSSRGSTSSSVAAPPMVQGVQALPTQMLQPHPMPHGTIPPGSARPLTNPPPPNSHPHLHSQTSASGAYAAQSGGYAAQSGGYAAQSGGYAAQYPGPVPAGSVSGSIVSMTGPQQQMPAHFMVPQAPYSDGRMDPPGTAVTARTKVGGRPAMSWAIALAAFGLFVGVGAVAVMHGNDGFTETSASFVDPSRAAGGKGIMAPGVAAGQLAVAPTPVPVAADRPAVVAVLPVAVPAAPAAGTVVAVAPTAEVAAAPVVTTPPAAGAAPVAPGAVAVAVPIAAPAVAPAAAPAATVAAARPASQRPAFVPQRPPPKPAPEEVAAKPAKPAKPAPAGKPGGDSAVDEEQRKALKALQESQLETPF